MFAACPTPRNHNWVTEWQMRSRHGGGPVLHLHAILYFPHRAEKMVAHVVDHWLAVSAPYGSESWCQHVAPSSRLEGWLQYLAKHGSRSVGNVQRLRGTMPDEWHTAGRLWGKGGAWPTRSQGVYADDAVMYLYRRLQRAYDRADASTRLRNAKKHRNARQQAAALKSVTASRQSLKYPNSRRADGDERITQKTDLVQRSALVALSGYLGDVNVDRWLHSLPEHQWRYSDDTEATPDPLSPDRAVGAGGAGV